MSAHVLRPFKDVLDAIIALSANPDTYKEIPGNIHTYIHTHTYIHVQNS